MTHAAKIIGLTGNIATGKSVIRRMLANSGALGIDADDIAHRMLYPGAPAYKPVIEAFSEKILSPQGEISRRKLGKIVFSEEEKLKTLENLIHPWVTIAIKKRIEKSSTPIVVIEAIKLLESELIQLCDTVWVSHASENHQIKRLRQTRNMNQAQARERIAAQPPQSEKLEHAEVVINTEGAFKDTWESMQNALNDTIQTHINIRTPHFNNSQGWQSDSIRNMSIEKLADCWQKFTILSPSDLYAHLGAQMVLPLYQHEQCSGFILWDNHNFTAAMNSIHPETLAITNAFSVLRTFETHARQKQCEILLMPHKFFAQNNIDYKDFGYKKQTPHNLTYPAWQTAIMKETQGNDTGIWAKIIDQPVETIANLT